MATILKTNGTQQKVQPKNGTDFQLDELQEIVGGYIEIVRVNTGEIIICNDNGKLYGLPVNDNATMLAHYFNAIANDDFIVGDVLICNKNQVK